MSAQVKQNKSRNILILAGLLLVAVCVIVGITVAVVFLVMNSQKVNKFPPYESRGYVDQSSADEKVRYVLIDIQLGGVEDYYRDYQDSDPNIRKALDLWDRGVRIVNIYQFDRVKMGEDGWQVVYGGTYEIVDCTDVLLTEDIGATGNDEARMRYILADAQLGGVIDYYRQYTRETAVKRAVELWDKGVRVANIDEFQRVIVGNAGWQVVYAGTTRPINGMDVILTTDAAAQSRTDSGAFDEARVRYILVDIQLSGSDGYYRGFPEDVNAVEAIRRWDSGVRVVNIDRFERKLVNGSWQIVYAGTKTAIDGMDVVLSSEASSSISNNGYCNNPYWPIVSGATWEFSVQETTSGQSGSSKETYTETWKIQSIGGDSGNASFELKIQDSRGNSRLEKYVCNSEGIFVEMTELIIHLLPESRLQTGEEIWYKNLLVTVLDPTSVTVPAGTFPVIVINRNWLGGTEELFFARGYGPVLYKTYADGGTVAVQVEKQLVEVIFP